MNEEQQFKQQAWVNGLAHINIQNAAAFVELAANIEETWRAKNEKSFFDKALDQIDNGYGAVGEKLGHDNIGGHEVVERWKPGMGLTYWVLGSDGDRLAFVWTNTPEQNAMLNFGTVFRTEIEALAARKKIAALLQSS